MNKKLKIAYQNLYNASEAGLRREFVALNINIREEERSLIKYLKLSI